MIDVAIAGGGPNGLMLAAELGLAGIRPVVLDPMPGPNPQPRANGIVGQGVRILDHRGLYNMLAGTEGRQAGGNSSWVVMSAQALGVRGYGKKQDGLQTA